MVIRPIEPRDKEAWAALHAPYVRGYGQEVTPALLDTVWGWLMSRHGGLEALVAEGEGGALVALAHFQPFVQTSRGRVIGYLNDLVVAEAHRGRGVGRAMLEAARAEARQRGWAVLRWICLPDNAPAVGLYDALATRTPWVVYDAVTEG